MLLPLLQDEQVAFQVPKLFVQVIVPPLQLLLLVVHLQSTFVSLFVDSV
jgi:hypothetical protein